MRLRGEIERVFGGHAFDMPLFYGYPGGLRFELSEGDAPIDQLLLAIRKAREVCGVIFDDQRPLVSCLRMRAQSPAFAHRRVLRELRAADIRIPRAKCIWLEAVPLDDRFDDDVEEFWVNVAFEAPIEVLQRMLWCAFSVDFGSIRPRPACAIYLFALAKGVMVFPYDDRGMDVVGPNQVLLSQLYRRFNSYLLDYERAAMEKSFESL